MAQLGWSGNVTLEVCRNGQYLTLPSCRLYPGDSVLACDLAGRPTGYVDVLEVHATYDYAREDLCYIDGERREEEIFIAKGHPVAAADGWAPAQDIACPDRPPLPSSPLYTLIVAPGCPAVQLGGHCAAVVVAEDAPWEDSAIQAAVDRALSASRARHARYFGGPAARLAAVAAPEIEL